MGKHTGDEGIKTSIDSLYNAILGGDTSAEKQLFEALSVRFRVIARKRIWDRQDADEVVQDALMAVFANYRDATIHSGFPAWAHKVLMHKVLNYYRSKARYTRRFQATERLDLLSEEWTSNPMLEPELRKCMRLILAAQPRYARILVLVYHGYGAGEICGKLSITKSNCYTILSRARSLIKLCLQKGDISGE